jgi:hypothetical protein
MDNNNKIRVIFTPKADDELSQIINKYKLDESLVIVKMDYISKDISLEKISADDAKKYLEKELSVSQQIAENIYKDIISRIIPLLEKVEEAKFEDPKFAIEISKKIFGEPLKNSGTKQEVSPEDKIPISFTDLSEKKPDIKMAPSAIEQKKIPKNENLAPKPKKTNSSDKYRETVE